MLLIDANKEDYVRYYNLGLTLLRKGGLIIVDNTLWSGKVADPAVNDDDTKGIRALNDAMKNDSRVDFTLLNLCDGGVCVCSGSASNFTRRLLTKSRYLWRYKLEIAFGMVFCLYSFLVKNQLCR